MDKFIVFIFGAVIGSFLNVCIYRMPKGGSIILPPSSCPNCKKGILWYDNIPVLSYIILGGRCRSCKAKISPRYILVEVLTAGILTLFFSVFGMSARFFSYSLMTCGLIVATFIDFEINEIPDEISVGGLITGLIIAAVFPSTLGAGAWAHGLLNAALGALAGGLSIYFMGLFGEFIFKREAMGGGDVKLMAMIGVFLGWKLVLVTFFVAPVFGSIAGIVLRIKDGREIIPYGPYLSLAALLSIFFGDRIIRLFFYGLY